MITVGSDFSGVGAFNQALNRLGIDYEEIFACDMDKYARDTFILNYGEPQYYPMNVYDREIPKDRLDIYMTSPPCQAFSLAGKRLGKEDKRGILFFNSHEFIKENKPRYFIFENVKGLLSDDNGKTFQEWISMLGGKSVNGNPILFAHKDAVPYHIYWKVLNAKNYGVPQNRERVFIVGIRDDQDNNFTFPKEMPLDKRLKDVLESDVDEKYFLSEKMIKGIMNTKFKSYANLIQEKEYVDCLKACDYKAPKSIKVKFGNANNYLKVTNFQGKDICNTIRTGGNGSMSDKHNWDTIKIKSGTSKGYEEAIDGDSINIAFASSDTRRGRVGKQVSQTLDTGCQMGVLENYKIRRLTPRECFRLMDFPDTFKWQVSDSQAYKQAGNSIVVNVLFLILKNLNL